MENHHTVNNKRIHADVISSGSTVVHISSVIYRHLNGGFIQRYENLAIVLALMKEYWPECFAGNIYYSVASIMVSSSWKYKTWMSCTESQFCSETDNFITTGQSQSRMLIDESLN